MIKPFRGCIFHEIKALLLLINGISFDKNVSYLSHFYSHSSSDTIDSLTGKYLASTSNKSLHCSLLLGGREEMTWIGRTFETFAFVFRMEWWIWWREVCGTKRDFIDYFLKLFFNIFKVRLATFLTFLRPTGWFIFLIFLLVTLGGPGWQDGNLANNQLDHSDSLTNVRFANQLGIKWLVSRM